VRRGLFEFDPSTMAWTDLTAVAGGSPPAGRGFHGFAAAGGRLYVHAGWGGYDYGGVAPHPISSRITCSGTRAEILKH
jgi:hypothetical protein